MLGDQRPFCVACWCPTSPTSRPRRKAKGWDASNRRALLRAAPVRALYQNVINELNAELAPFETIKKFELLDRDLSADAGELTPTLKVRRKIVSQTFAEVIESMYTGAPTPVA